MSLAEVIVGSQLSSRRTSSRMELSVLACAVVAIIRLSKFHRGRSVCELTARKQNKVGEQGKLSTERTPQKPPVGRLNGHPLELPALNFKLIEDFHKCHNLRVRSPLAMDHWTVRRHD